MRCFQNNFLTFADMSRFSEDIERKSKTYERERSRRDAIGKYFLDLSKLTFAAMVVGMVPPLITNGYFSGAFYFVVVAGILLTIVFAYIGNQILKKQ